MISIRSIALSFSSSLQFTEWEFITLCYLASSDFNVFLSFYYCMRLSLKILVSFSNLSQVDSYAFILLSRSLIFYLRFLMSFFSLKLSLLVAFMSYSNRRDLRWASLYISINLLKFDSFFFALKSALCKVRFYWAIAYFNEDIKDYSSFFYFNKSVLS